MKRFFFKPAGLWVLIGVLLFSGLPQAASAEEIPRMGIDELKGLLDDPDVMILDVRSGRDWDSSEFKIRGALRSNPGNFDQWADQYPKDKTLVLYCA